MLYGERQETQQAARLSRPLSEQQKDLFQYAVNLTCRNEAIAEMDTTPEGVKRTLRGRVGSGREGAACRGGHDREGRARQAPGHRAARDPRGAAGRGRGRRTTRRESPVLAGVPPLRPPAGRLRRRGDRRRVGGGNEIQIVDHFVT
jgi:hypothetical protein